MQAWVRLFMLWQISTLHDSGQPFVWVLLHVGLPWLHVPRFYGVYHVHYGHLLQDFAPSLASCYPPSFQCDQTSTDVIDAWHQQLVWCLPKLEVLHRDIYPSWLHCTSIESLTSHYGATFEILQLWSAKSYYLKARHSERMLHTTPPFTFNAIALVVSKFAGLNPDIHIHTHKYTYTDIYRQIHIYTGICWHTHITETSSYPYRDRHTEKYAHTETSKYGQACMQTRLEVKLTHSYCLLLTPFASVNKRKYTNYELNIINGLKLCQADFVKKKTAAVEKEI